MGNHARAVADDLTRIQGELGQHRRLEEELRQREERLRLLIEQGRDLVFRYAFHPPRFEYISPGVADLCGYTAAEFYDNPDLIFDIIHADDRVLLQQYIAAGDYSRTVALRCLRRDGEVIWVEQRALPSYDAGGELVALEGILRDVSRYRYLLDDREPRSVSVQERERMLTALRRIGSETLQSLDLDHVIDTLARQVVHAGILRSLIIPLKRDGRVLAVLATGSTTADGEETLRRIEAMEPLLEQAAVALDHALVHGRVRDRAREVHALNGRLRAEVSRRLRAEETLRSFSQRTVHLAEEERRRVARELHDGVSQLLCAVGFSIEASQREAGDQAGLDHTRELLDRTLSEVLRISQDLRPDVLDDLGLAPAVRSLCDGCERRTGLTVAHDLERVPGELPSEVEITVYRLLQETLHHWERGRKTDGLHIQIRAQDDGAILSEVVGAGDLRDAITTETLQHWHERAGLIGGSVAIEPSAAGGARLVVHLPLPGGSV